MRLNCLDRTRDDYRMIVETQVGASHEINYLRSSVKRPCAQKKCASRRGTSLDGHETVRVGRIEIGPALV
ncbi:hypothetical protein MesoLj131c_65750 (plasmid) [Mesorhizobium sp. 131-3-5]|nr:hypothetical protein MesoLj131c_65750 [Mesorhizobium sp. 131-3-5]